MINYTKVRSTVKPDEKVIDEYSVWISTDIIKIDDYEFEYNQVQYEKDEYIKLMSEQNEELTHLINTMLGVDENG